MLRGPAWLTLVAALVMVAPAICAETRPPVPTLEERQALYAKHQARLRQPAEQDGPLDGQADFDVLEYDLTLFLDMAGERIEGRSAVTFTLAAGVPSLDELVLDLHDGNLTVSEVTYDGVPVALAQLTHQNDSLSIPLAPPLTDGSATVVVSYEGQPLELSFGTLTFTEHGDPPEPVIFTLSEPFLGRGWWPSKDVPDDKATISVRVEAPEDLVVVSNGLEVSREPGRPGYLVTTWHESYPVSTYLVSIAVSNYELFEDTYLALDGTPMPVQHWVYPEILDAAMEDFNVTVPAMEYFAEAFYEYPFLDEKYGHATIPLWGAMEHQTATSYGAQLIRGDHRNDWIVVHELAHQWWGNHVGPETFESIWLNEGFATYSEALWWEWLHGRTAYHEYMLAMDRLLRWGVEFPGTVHDPDAFFNGTVYDKGAWVLHMLRWVLGQPSASPDQEVILELLRDHGAEHPFGSAATDDFLATASARAGEDLSWFFDQWVHRAGRPDYGVDWAAAPQADGTWILHLRVIQRQAEFYRMPVLVRITLPSGVVEEIVWNDGSLTDYQWSFAEAPTSVTWDEQGWVLKTFHNIEIDRDDDGWPNWLDGCPDVWNPGQEDLNSNGIQDACEPGLDFDGDGVLNEDDCNPSDAGAWTEPTGETLILATKLVDGTPVLSFQNPDPMGQRFYSTDLSMGSLDALRAGGGFRDASCLVAGHPDAKLEDPAPGSGDVYFIAHPWNGCGPTQGGVPLSPCR